jgi:hypothetical protein
MSGSIAQLLAQNRHAAELVRKRDLAAFGEVRRVGAAWVWQLHKDGLPGALAALVGPSPLCLSEQAAWDGLDQIIAQGLRSLRQEA